MDKIFKTAFISIIFTGFLLGTTPQTASGMGGPCGSGGHTEADHKCNGYGLMIGHPEFNDHCNHTYGDISGNYPGAENCCNDPGWVAANPPAPLASSGGISAGTISSGNNAKTFTRAVSTRPRALGHSLNHSLSNLSAD